MPRTILPAVLRPVERDGRRSRFVLRRHLLSSGHLAAHPDARSDDIDIAILSDAFKLTGGEIRNAIYTAHLLAMRHCVKGLWSELAKIGRLP